MNEKKQIKTTDWLIRGMSKEQLEREKREAIMSADLEECITYDEWSAREYGIDSIDFDTMAEKMVTRGYRKQSEPISCTHENGGEWISVEDRLPEENGRYLVNVNISHLAFENLYTVAIMAYGKSHGFYLYNDVEKVTHWMPLPEPPTEKEN